MKVIVKYKHWKTGEELVLCGKLVYDNPLSERIVVKKPDGSFEDIIRSTIIEMSKLL